MSRCRRRCDEREGLVWTPGPNASFPGKNRRRAAAGMIRRASRECPSTGDGESRPIHVAAKSPNFAMCTHSMFCGLIYRPPFSPAFLSGRPQRSARRADLSLLTAPGRGCSGRVPRQLPSRREPLRHTWSPSLTSVSLARGPNDGHRCAPPPPPRSQPRRRLPVAGQAANHARPGQPPAV